MSGSIITMFNKFGTLFCGHALAMLVQSSILILVLLIIDLFLRKRIRAVFRYCIWLLVFVKLVIPPTFSLPTGIGYWQDDYWPTNSIAVETTGVSATEHAEALKTEYSVVPSELSSVRPAESVETPVMDASVGVLASPSINWQAIVLLGWFFGVLALAVLLMRRAWFVRGLIAQSEPAEIELSGLLSDCCRRLGIRKRIELRISQNSLSPAACGLLKPKIILPSSLLAHFSTDKLRTVLLHELAHIKRGDLWINFIQTILQIFYFYNPLLWLANVKVRRVREQAVDEMVLVLLGDKAKTYSSTLVDIAEIAFARPTLGLRLIGVVESKNVLTSRIRYITSRPFPRSAKLGIGGLFVVTILSAVLLPMAKAQRTSKPSADVTAEGREAPTKSLHGAAADDDLEQIKPVLAKGSGIDTRGEKDMTLADMYAEEGPTSNTRGEKDMTHAYMMYAEEGPTSNTRGEEDVTHAYMYAEEVPTSNGGMSKPAESRPTSGESRILHFPEGRSMGTLYVSDVDKAESISYDDWTRLCEATGSVTVPAGKVLKLVLSKDAGGDLSPLSVLGSDDLTRLECHRVEIDDEQLKHVSHMTGLRDLYLRSPEMLGTGLKYLANLKSLKSLDLGSTQVGDNELAYLSNFPALESLNLWGARTTDAGMVHVGKITSLRSLILDPSVSDEGLAHLKDLASLRHLTTWSRSFGDEGLKHLANMTQMETLDFYYCQVSDAGLVHLKKMANLKKLFLNWSRITEEGLVHLKGLKALESLALPFEVADTGLIHLSHLPSIKTIKIDGNSITAKGLAALSTMKSLESIDVGGNRADACIAELPDLPGLKSLSLGAGLSDEGLMRLRNRQSLQELRITNAPVMSEDIAALAALPSLQALAFENIELAAEDGWAALGRLSSLQRLSFGRMRSKVTDGHIAHLAGLQSLKQLSINRLVTKDGRDDTSLDVTDKGLGYISRLKSLEHLRLMGAEFTDEGLLQLSDIPTLKTVDLRNCGVTEQGLQNLRKKLPALKW